MSAAAPSSNFARYAASVGAALAGTASASATVAFNPPYATGDLPGTYTTLADNTVTGA
jgi:hypothetical protein